MSRRTRKEINDEVTALRALKPVGEFAEKTRANIANAIDELHYRFDRTAGEWEELSEAEQDLRNQVDAWVEGLNEAPYSDRKSWGKLVK